MVSDPTQREILDELRRIRHLEERRLDFEYERARDACPGGGDHDLDVQDLGQGRQVQLYLVCTKCSYKKKT